MIDKDFLVIIALFIYEEAFKMILWKIYVLLYTYFGHGMIKLSKKNERKITQWIDGVR